MNRRRTCCQMNPLTGICASRGNTLGYRYTSPNGDDRSHGTSAMHSVAHPPSVHSSLITVHSSYTFSAKEKDSETGFSYFGSRYYSSDLSIWLSVDPMSDKYPSFSPYTYCANNPVKLVDPDGKDWFENELTGDVYYSKYLSKEDVSHIEGKGWKWMGEDNMFGSSPTQLTMVDHFDKASFVKSDQEGVETALFEGDNAKQFMSEMGYSFKPKLASVVSKDVTNMITEADGTPRYNTTHYDSYEKIHTSVYALKGSKGNYTILKATPYKDNPGPCVSITTRTELRLYDYNKSPKEEMRNLGENISHLVKSIVPTLFKSIKR